MSVEGERHGQWPLCYRPVVGYTERGMPKQVTSRSSDTPTPHREGDAVAVLVDADGQAWIASEWDTAQGVREREFGVTTHAISFRMRRIYGKLQVLEVGSGRAPLSSPCRKSPQEPARLRPLGVRGRIIADR